MHFDLVGEITDVVTIASGRGIRDLARLRRRHRPGAVAEVRGRRCRPPEQWAGPDVLSYTGTRLTGLAG